MAKRRRPMSEINVVPYIDVMLVLLVIFMATAPLLTQGVVVDLPDAPSEPVESDQEDPLVVSVRSDGAIFVNLGIQNADDEGTRVTIYSLEDQAGKILNARVYADIFVEQLVRMGRALPDPLPSTPTLRPLIAPLPL